MLASLLTAQVNLATSMNARLEAQETARAAHDPSAPAPPSESDATLIKSSLVTLGLPAPAITADMQRDERLYHEGLARELAGLLIGPGRMMDERSGGRPIMSLDEVWGLWNRVRGVGASIRMRDADVAALLSPADAAKACAYLDNTTRPPITLRQLKSGLKILHHQRYAPDVFARHALDLVSQAPNGLTTLDLASIEGLTAALLDELLQAVESDTGLICRDEGDRTGLRWWPNRFLDPH